MNTNLSICAQPGSYGTSGSDTPISVEPSKFCGFCGIEKILMPTGYYSESTGKPFERLYCMNINCDNNQICTHDSRKDFHIYTRLDRMRITNNKCPRCNKLYRS